MKSIKKIWTGLWTEEFKYIITLFVGSRIALTIIGALARIMAAKGPITENFTSYILKNLQYIWGQWDTGWYMIIVKDWYSAKMYNGNQATYGFFPLYPTLMKILGTVIGSPWIAGIIISNIFFIIAAVFLYKLVLRESDKATALNTVKYMFVFPTAFIFSGALTESLFIALVIMAFYYAKENKWLYAGICGFFFALTKHIGIFVLLPLVFEYFKSRKFNLRKIRPDILWLALPVIGFSIFCIYCYYLTGDFLAFATIQKTGWGHTLTNPLAILYSCFISNDIYLYSHAVFTTVFLAFLFINYKKIDSTLLIYALIFSIIPLTSGLKTTYGILRYLLIVFPVFMILGKVTIKNPRLNEAVTISLALLQGFLMAYWSIGSLMVV